MFIDEFNKLCEEIGKAPTRVLDELGMSRGSYTQWAKGAIPSNSTKKKIADYFGVPVKRLTEGEIKKSSYSEEQEEMAELLQEFRDNPELRTLFSLTNKATPADLRKMINVIKAMRGNGNGYGDY